MILRKEMKDLLLLCTKNVHFSYDNKSYSQKDDVVMGSSPLGPAIAGNISTYDLLEEICR